MKPVLCIFLILTSCAQTFQTSESHFTNDFTIEINKEEHEANRVARSLAESHGFRLVGQMYFPSIGHVYTLRHQEVSTRSKRRAEDYVQLLSNHPMVRNAAQETILVRDKRDRDIVYDKQLEMEPEYYEDKSVFQRFDPVGLKKDGIPTESNPMGFKDPFYRDQWYLENIGQAGGPSGLDINVVPAWKKGFTGEGVVVTTLDDGIDHQHGDLKRNYDPKASTDLNDIDDEKHDPQPDMNNPSENSHGTRCAGEIAAQANNDICGVGVAYNAKIGGIRMLDGRVTDSLEAKALLFNNNYIQVFSASWGPRDNGATMEAPHKYCAAALKKGAEEGRNGKGSIFMWATGNGGKLGDCCNADGYVGSIYTLAIGSVNNYAQSTYFTESCPSQLAVIFTGGYHDYNAVKQGRETHPILKVVTTDVGGKCTLNFQGTSSAAPLAAGCMALTVQANPNITWRDAQHIIVNTARIPNKDEPGWIINGANKHVNPKFGFGVMDCGKMVEVAQTWKNVPPQHVCLGRTVKVDKDLTSSGTVTSHYMTDGCQRDADTRIDHLEHVQLRLKMKHSRRGALKIVLTSPAGTPSEMLSPRQRDEFDGEFEFTFMSVHKWGENPRGTWKLEVKDQPRDDESDNKGHVDEWQLIMYGYSDSRNKKDATSEKHKASIQAKTAGEHTLAKIMQKEQQKSDSVQIKTADGVNTSSSKTDAGDATKTGDTGSEDAGGDSSNDGGNADGGDNGSDSQSVFEDLGQGDGGKNKDGGDSKDNMDALLSELLDKLTSLSESDGGEVDNSDKMTKLFYLLKNMIKSGRLKGLSHLSDDDIRDVLRTFMDTSKDRNNNDDETYVDDDSDEDYANSKYLLERKNVQQEEPVEDIQNRDYNQNVEDSEDDRYDLNDLDVLEKINRLLEN